MHIVDADVLRANTPLEVFRLAAGEHQNSQRDVQGMSMADAFAFLCKTAKEKAAKMGSPYFRTTRWQWQVGSWGCRS